MIIQATPYGTKKEEPFAFTYSGDFTDSRVDGIGDVTLNTSGTLTVTGKAVTVRVYILAGGGGAASWTGMPRNGTGGGGGNQEVEVELTPGTYEIIIGSGGTIYRAAAEGTAGAGGDTTAFGVTSTGGKGGKAAYPQSVGGAGGSPNGSAGVNAQGMTVAAGGAPNGGGISGSTPQPGGDGLVRITFS